MVFYLWFICDIKEAPIVEEVPFFRRESGVLSYPMKTKRPLLLLTSLYSIRYQYQGKMLRISSFRILHSTVLRIEAH